MSDTQQTIANIRQMLQQQGLPLTTENLNRAMLAMSRNEPLNMDGIERSVERSMAPRAVSRRAAPQQPPQQAAPQGPVRGGSSEDPREDGQPPVRTPQARPGERGSDNMPRGDGQVRRGSANGAQVINEDDPTAGMFGGPGAAARGGRQADETGIDQTGLALALLSPFLALGGGGGGGAAAAGSAALPELGVTLAPRAAQRALPGAQRALPAPQGRLPGPANGGANAGGGSAAQQQVGGPTVSQTRLPPADGDLRRRMIERNIERSNRNAQRTRDERAAGNNVRGRRERIEPVPAGPTTPRPQQEAIPLGKPRYRVPTRQSNE